MGVWFTRYFRLKLLAHDPNYEQRLEIAAGYVAFAKVALDKSPTDAMAALRRAERLDPTLKVVRTHVARVLRAAVAGWRQPRRSRYVRRDGSCRVREARFGGR